jgi:hypothetical protein
MSIDSETLRKIEDALEYKRSQNPLIVEFNRLAEDVYPYKKLHSIFKLGQVNMLASIKNDIYKYLEKDGQECIDTIIKESIKYDEEMKNMLNKLLDIKLA